ncbi:MAG TPA: hypothetical protein VNO24_02150, partial [Blastocatellia bacterium]|nr:hypothetical protein [Blastocatellia bacterium]
VGDFFPWSIFLIPLAWFAASGLWSMKHGTSRSVADPNGSALLAIWIIVIVVFFSFSKSKEDLYILPVYPAAAALVGQLLARCMGSDEPRQQGVVRFTTLLQAASIATSGAVILYFFGMGSQTYEIAGARLIGCVAILGAMMSAAAAIVKRTRQAVVATALTVAVCSWVFVLWALPDFERFKPVRSMCEVIASEAGPDAFVGYYRTAYPSMVFYLRRPIFEYYHQDEIEAALISGKEVFCLITAAEYEGLRARMPVQTRVLASHPIFQVKLNGILDRVELPRVLLISNKGGTNVTQ